MDEGMSLFIMDNSLVKKKMFFFFFFELFYACDVFFLGGLVL